MEWLFYAFLATALFSAGNILDKIILSKAISAKSYFYYANIFYISYFTLFLFSSLNNLPGRVILIGILSGFIHMFAIYFYMDAMSKEDASVVIMLFQMIPVLTLIFAGVFLNERLSSLEILVFFLFLIGSIIMSIKRDKNIDPELRETAFKMPFMGHFRFSAAILSVILAILFISISSVTIKYIYTYASVSQGALLNALGHMFIFPWLFLSSDKKTFFKEITRIPKKWAVLIVLTSFFFMIPVIISFIALSIGPVSLVSSISSMGGIFVFAYTLALSKLFPKILHEPLEKQVIIRKTLAIFIMLIGFFMLTK